MCKTQGRIGDYKGKHNLCVKTELCPRVKNVPYCMAEILPIRHETQYNKSINHLNNGYDSINQIGRGLIMTIVYLIIINNITMISESVSNG